MASRYENERRDSAFTFGSNIKEHAPADVDLPANVKGVFFNDEGTVNITNQDGSTITALPVQAGACMWIVPKRVTAMTGPTKCYLVT